MNAVKSLKLTQNRDHPKVEINPKYDNDEPYIHGMCSLHGNKILIADCRNNCVKQANLKTGMLEVVYRSEWKVINIQVFNGGDSLFLIESNPQNKGIKISSLNLIRAY